MLTRVEEERNEKTNPGPHVRRSVRYVWLLNAPSGNPVPEPECAQVVNGQLVPQPPGPDNMFIPAGGSVTVPLEPEVNAKYQCLKGLWPKMNSQS